MPAIQPKGQRAPRNLGQLRINKIPGFSSLAMPLTSRLAASRTSSPEGDWRGNGAAEEGGAHSHMQIISCRSRAKNLVL